MAAGWPVIEKEAHPGLPILPWIRFRLWKALFAWVPLTDWLIPMTHMESDRSA